MYCTYRIQTPISISPNDACLWHFDLLKRSMNAAVAAAAAISP